MFALCAARERTFFDVYHQRAPLASIYQAHWTAVDSYLEFSVVNLVPQLNINQKLISNVDNTKRKSLITTISGFYVAILHALSLV